VRLALSLTGLLTLAVQAQVPGRALPWDGQPEPPWRASEMSPAPPPLPPEVTAPRSVSKRTVQLSSHGVLKILDDRGLVLLRQGLPGRPLRLWRDAGTPMDLSGFPCVFPGETPLSKGAEGMILETGDFRPNLKGLLWILDDGGRQLTVVHPATGQVVFLPLPGGRDQELFLFPDHLELRDALPEPGSRNEIARWSVPWVGLLPQLLKLSSPPPAPPPGTALSPFTRDE